MSIEVSSLGSKVSRIFFSCSDRLHTAVWSALRPSTFQSSYTSLATPQLAFNGKVSIHLRRVNNSRIASSSNLVGRWRTLIPPRTLFLYKRDPSFARYWGRWYLTLLARVLSKLAGVASFKQAANSASCNSAFMLQTPLICRASILFLDSVRNACHEWAPPWVSEIAVTTVRLCHGLFYQFLATSEHIPWSKINSNWTFSYKKLIQSHLSWQNNIYYLLSYTYQHQSDDFKKLSF